MAPDNLIFLMSGVLLSKQDCPFWREIQNAYEDYMASIHFQELEEVIEYLILDYKVSRKFIEDQIDGLAESLDHTIRLNLNT